MVHYLLMITAELENLTNLQPQGGCDNPDFTFTVQLKCSCGEVSAKETWLCLNETLPVPNGKGTTNLVQKCKFCTKEGTVTLVPGKGRPLTQELSQAGKHAPLMQFDCRGFEPTDFMFGTGWQAASIAGTKFDGIDLSEGEFAEYDEKGEYPVTVSNPRFVFKVVKPQ